MLFAFQFQSPGPFIPLFHIGSFQLRWYGFLIASAVIIGVFLSQYLAQRRQVNPELIADVIVWMVLGAIPCARLYYVLFEWSKYATAPPEILKIGSLSLAIPAPLAIWTGGIAIHGAIIGGTLAVIIFSRINKVSVWQLADLIVPSLALGQAIGRWGNFFNSEAFGRPTNLPWKLFIPVSNRPVGYEQYEYFHPTFLYESLWNLVVCGMLLWLFFWGLRHRDRLKIGTLALLYLIAYSSGRIWIEGLRTDSLMLGSFRIAQIISLLGIALGLLGLTWLYWYRKSLPDVVVDS